MRSPKPSSPWAQQAAKACEERGRQRTGPRLPRTRVLGRGHRAEAGTSERAGPASAAPPCPSSHLQTQVTATLRGRACCPDYRPGGDLKPRSSRLRRQPPAACRRPRPAPHAAARKWEGARAPLRLRPARPAPPRAPALRRVSPPPAPRSPGVAPGTRGGKARDAGPPPGWGGTWSCGSGGRHPSLASGLLTGRERPRAGFVKGKGAKGGKGLREKRRCCALAHCGLQGSG